MGESESCSSRQSEWSPVRNRKSRQKVEVCNEVLCRLRELGLEEANEPGFEEELSAHFSMLPPRLYGGECTLAILFCILLVSEGGASSRAKCEVSS
ncbi:hypothetical protein OROMI_030474 [Orobanche minor]